MCINAFCLEETGLKQELVGTKRLVLMLSMTGCQSVPHAGETDKTCIWTVTFSCGRHPGAVVWAGEPNRTETGNIGSRGGKQSGIYFDRATSVCPVRQNLNVIIIRTQTSVGNSVLQAYPILILWGGQLLLNLSSNTLVRKFLVSLNTLISFMFGCVWSLQDSGPPKAGLDTLVLGGLRHCSSCCSQIQELDLIRSDL